MYLGRVVGTVVATVKISHLEGRKLLMVSHLDLQGRETDAYDIAVDVAQAGPGDTVLVIDEGNGARQILGLVFVGGKLDKLDAFNDGTTGHFRHVQRCSAFHPLQKTRSPLAVSGSFLHYS